MHKKELCRYIRLKQGVWWDTACKCLEFYAIRYWKPIQVSEFSQVAHSLWIFEYTIRGQRMTIWRSQACTKMLHENCFFVLVPSTTWWKLRVWVSPKKNRKYCISSITWILPDLSHCNSKQKKNHWFCLLPCLRTLCNQYKKNISQVTFYDSI